MVRPISGVGALIVNGARHDGARYRIDVFGGHGDEPRQGMGSLSTHAVSALLEAFDGGEVLLELHDGQRVRITPRKAEIAESPPRLLFNVTGPIPR